MKNKLKKIGFFLLGFIFPIQIIFFLCFKVEYLSPNVRLIRKGAAISTLFIIFISIGLMFYMMLKGSVG